MNYGFLSNDTEKTIIQPIWRTVWRFLKNLKIELPYDTAIPLLGIYPEKTIKWNLILTLKPCKNIKWTYSDYVNILCHNHWCFRFCLHNPTTLFLATYFTALWDDNITPSPLSSSDTPFPILTFRRWHYFLVAMEKIWAVWRKLPYAASTTSPICFVPSCTHALCFASCLYVQTIYASVQAQSFHLGTWSAYPHLLKDIIADILSSIINFSFPCNYFHQHNNNNDSIFILLTILQALLYANLILISIHWER